MSLPSFDSERYRAVTARSLPRTEYWDLLSPEMREVLAVTSLVLPFRANPYVLRELIDWQKVPEDPMYQLTFAQRPMLADGEYRWIRDLLRRGAPADELSAAALTVRAKLNPHPAGQLTHNVPQLYGRSLPGLQHKYPETVLYFPAQGQTCHAYCTYCFRWPQFVDDPTLRFEARDPSDLIAYLVAHPEVSDVLITGGDAMIMKTEVLRRHVEPLLDERLAHLVNIRIGTKALAYWPYRFVSDPDADDLLALFSEVVAAGRHLALMAHYSHPVELRSEIAQRAVARVRATGAEIRMQAPLVRHINDSVEVWVELWSRGVQMGMIPYYMFIERDTGPRNYFEVPLARAHQIFTRAVSQVSGLARTVRGPLMSAFPGKVRVVGVLEIAAGSFFVLDFLQARDLTWLHRPFLARFDPGATWLDQLVPDVGERFFFESEERPSYSYHPDELVPDPAAGAFLDD